MQVRKFEAKTMKEALELVKTHMGPEAIILSARDTNRGFGLVGERSVEVTAAVSEETLRRKKIAEAKLREDMRKKFQQIPASQQKQFINRVFENKAPVQMTPVRATATVGAAAAISPEDAKFRGMRYIDIADDAQAQAPTYQAPVVQARPATLTQQVSAQQRVRSAAQRALAGLETIEPYKPTPHTTTSNTTIPAAVVAAASDPAQVQALQTQIVELKSIIEKFQKMPQVPLTLHPGAEYGIPFELTGLYQRLIQQGVQEDIAIQWVKKAQKEIDSESLHKPALVDAWMVRQVMQSVEVVKNPTAARYHVFMGCTGQGKTTTLVKLASHLVLKEKKKIAIVSLDTIKVGAADQLRIYAQILNVPFAVVRNPEEWKVAEKKLAGVQHILVDCPGFNLQNYQEIEWLRQMIPPAHLDRSVHYVQSVLARDQETMDVASRYNMIGFNDVIFTRLDESSAHGLLLNFQNKFKVPMHSFGLGSKVPEDYEWATKERIVDLIFKLTKASGQRKEDKHG